MLAQMRVAMNTVRKALNAWIAGIFASRYAIVAADTGRRVGIFASVIEARQASAKLNGRIGAVAYRVVCA